MTTQTEALKLAFEALDGLYLPNELERVNKAITAINEALAQPEQEPVACLVETEQGVMVWLIEDINEAGTYCEENEFPVFLYTTPPKREWVGLTERELVDLWYKESLDWLNFAQIYEAKLKEKNT